MRKRRKKKRLMNILLIIFICLFVYSAYNVIMWLKSDREIKELESGLYKEIVTVAESNSQNVGTQQEESNEQVVVDFKKLKEINKDVIGWIEIDNTYINYPILQGETDEYYLRKDIYKEYNFSGSIFVYSDVNRQFLDENTVIYGHNMKNDRMFANLNQINNGTLGKDIYINIFTEDKTIVYKVFSSYVEEPSIDIIKNKFTEQEKRDYINTAIKKSEVAFQPNINYKNKMITLITCGSRSEERIIVHAIAIN